MKLEPCINRKLFLNLGDIDPQYSYNGYFYKKCMLSLQFLIANRLGNRRMSTTIIRDIVALKTTFPITYKTIILPRISWSTLPIVLVY